MIIIHLNNASCQVDTKNKEILTLISELLTYYDKSAEFSYFKNLKQVQRMTALFSRAKDDVEKARYQAQVRKLNFMITKLDKDRKITLLNGSTFPTGLLNRVLDLLDAEGLDWQINDLRKNGFERKELKLLRPLPELRHYQIAAAKAAVSEERGVIEAATGVGKSMIIVDLVAKFKTKTIIVTPSKSINDGIYDTLVNFYGDSVVGKLTKTTKKTKWISVVNIQTLVNIDSHLLWDQGTVVIDEFHHAGAAQYLKVNSDQLKSCYFRIGLTATFFRNAGDDMALEGVLSNIIFKYDSKTAIAEGYLTKPEFRWLDVPGIKKMNYQVEYKKGLVENKARNQKIADTCKLHLTKSVVVLVQQIGHGEALESLIPGSVFLNGNEKDDERQRILEDFRTGKIKQLIGTGVIGEGVDLPRAEVLILAGGGKSKSQVMQNVGRVLRLFPGKDKALIYDFEDRGTKYLEGHAEERAAIYSSEYID